MLDLIPLPASLQALDGGGARLGASATVFAAPELLPARRLLARLLGAGTGWDLAPAAAPDDAAVVLALDPDLAAVPESYTLTSSPDGVRIGAGGLPGALHAVQTLRQLFPADVFRAAPPAELGEVELPAVSIADSPRFAYRGVMVDVARHFLPKADLLRLIDTFASLKFNVVHLHLTDDQGWRVEINAYPRLTEVASWRSRSSLGDWRAGLADPTPHGGFYTQDDLREIVAFCSQRGITVLPEIDVPGHSQAAIAAYPWLGGPNATDEVEVWPRWGVNDLVLDPSERSLEFYRTVLDEVMEIFPGPWIGVGGDEVPLNQWRTDPAAVARAQELGLTGVAGLHGWFVGELARHIAAAGRTVAVWDELAGAELPEGTLVHVWRGTAAIEKAEGAGQAVVLCTEKELYFDYVQSPDPEEPVPVGSVITFEDVAAYEPPVTEALGLQGNLWSEHLDSPQRVEYAAFPRVFALAEAAWTAPERRDADDLSERVRFGGLPRLSAAGVDFRPFEGPLPWQRRPGVPGHLHGSGFVAGHTEEH